MLLQQGGVDPRETEQPATVTAARGRWGGSAAQHAQKSDADRSQAAPHKTISMPSAAARTRG
jgi:hypothetical protein